MEPNTKLVVITLVLALTLTAATGLETCGMGLSGLYSCKPYVQITDPVTTPIDPKGPCCTALSKANFKCLCEQATKTNIPGIDFARATKLPTECGLPNVTC